MEAKITLPLLVRQKEITDIKEEIIQFYEEATVDYKFWSKDLNMHFGYYVPFKTSILKRDTMLNEMNSYLFSKLKIEKKNAHIVDLGCGMGATIKYGIQKYTKLTITGCTISPFQVKYGNQFINSERGMICKRDYTDTKFQNNSFDGALAIESFCHSACSKEALKEAYRILKPNSILTIADAFCKKDTKKLNFISSKIHEGLCASWSLESLGDIISVKKDLEAVGFKDVKVQNKWYRVAPSVFHAPFAIIGFVVKKILKREALKPESIKNLKGSFYALLTGLLLQDFGYYVITAKK